MMEEFKYNENVIAIWSKLNEVIKKNNAYDFHIQNIRDDQSQCNEAAKLLQKGFIDIGTKLNEIVDQCNEYKREIELLKKLHES